VLSNIYGDMNMIKNAIVTQ